MIISYRESLALLKLQPGYTAEQLKISYRKAAHQHHPDKGGDAEKFKRINEAYKFLTDHPVVPIEPYNVTVKKTSNGITVTVYGGYGGFTIRF